MAQEVIIVGAGLIGSMIALRLVKAGQRVTVIDRAGPGAGASGASFGWINASFYLDEDHHRLRVAGIAAYRRLVAQVPQLPVTWQSCLWFEEQGPALDQMEAALQALDYPVHRVSRAGFEALSPGVVAPDAALHFTAEGVADPAALTHAVARAAAEGGARFILGHPVVAIDADARTPSVMTQSGRFSADRVIVAAGTGAADLIGLPMLTRPGLLMRTQPVPPMLAHVLVGPEGEIKQDTDGCLVMPTAAGHQGDATEALPQRPDALADDALWRLQRRIPGPALRWSQVRQANRPVPQDGQPVIGPVAPGVYAAVMHSGVTLAALVGEMVAEEFTQGPNAMLEPYRPSRFA